MTKKEIVLLACKLFALLIIVTSFIQIITLFPHLVLDLRSSSLVNKSEAIFHWYVNLFSSTIAIILGIAIWHFAGKLAEKTGISFGADEKISALSIEDIKTVAFSVVGLVLVVRAIPKLSVQIVKYVFLKFDAYAYLYDMAKIKSDWCYDNIYSVIELCLGVWLLFGSRGIAKFIIKMRDIKSDKDKEKGKADIP